EDRVASVGTTGVQLIVGLGRTPIAVDETEIETLRRAVSSGQPIRPWPYIKVGQKVEIERGPLQGLSGIVLRIKNVDRLIVSVSLLMRSVAVEVDQASVRPMKRATPSEYSNILSA